MKMKKSQTPKEDAAKRLVGKREHKGHFCRKIGCKAAPFSTASNRGRHERSCKVPGDIPVKDKSNRCKCGARFARAHGLQRHTKYSCKMLKLADDNNKNNNNNNNNYNNNDLNFSDSDEEVVPSTIVKMLEEMIPGSPEPDYQELALLGLHGLGELNFQGYVPVLWIFIPYLGTIISHLIFYFGPATSSHRISPKVASR